MKKLSKGLAIFWLVSILVLFGAAFALATVTSETTRISYAGNGSNTVFAYPFKIYADADLLVIIEDADGDETVQTLTTHYTVSGAGNDSGGNVTMTTAPASGETLTIMRDRALKQETDYVQGGPFLADSHEDALDELTILVQQLQEQLDRAIKVNRSSTLTDIEIEDPGAGEYLRWNLLGNGVDATAQTNDLGNFLASGTGAVSRTAQAKMGDIISVKDFGVAGDGTDETTGIQAAVTAAAGGICYFPEPASYYRVTTDITVSANTWLMGSGAGCDIRLDKQTGNHGVFLVNGADNVKITGFYFKGNNTSITRMDGTYMWNHGISAKNSNYLYFAYNHFYELWGDGIILSYSTAPNGCDYSEVAHNVFERLGRHGFTMNDGQFNRIHDNLFIDSSLDQETDSGSSKVSYNSYFNNTMRMIDLDGEASGDADGIYFSISGRTAAGDVTTIVTGNTIIGAHFIVLTLPYSIISDNICTEFDGADVNYPPMWFYEMDHTLFRNNIVEATSFGGASTNGRGAVTFLDCDNSEVNGLICTNYDSGTGGHGVGVRDCGNFTLDGVVSAGHYGETVHLYSGNTGVIVNGGLGGFTETVTGTVTLMEFGSSQLNSVGGAITATLPDGQGVGQRKMIIMTEASNCSTVSVTHHVTSDPEVYDLQDVGDTLILEWNGIDWLEVHNNGCETNGC